MATIVKRGSRQWLVRIRRKGWPAQAATFRSKAEAQRWANEIESAMDAGRFTDSSEARATTLSEALARYSREISPGKKGCKQELQRIGQIQRHRIAQYALANIRGADMAEYRDERLSQINRRTSKPLSPNTVNNELILISHLYNIAIKEWGMHSLENPVAKIRRPKLPRGRERRVSPAEENRLLSAADSEMRVILIVAIETAMRRSEIAALEWAQVKPPVIELHDSKNDNPRRVPMSPRCIAAFRDLPHRIDGKIFSIRANTITDKFKDLTASLGIENLHFHDLRHEGISRLFERGFTIAEVSAATGHKTWSMLARYTHIKAEFLAEKMA